MNSTNNEDKAKNPLGEPVLLLPHLTLTGLAPLRGQGQLLFTAKTSRGIWIYSEADPVTVVPFWQGDPVYLMANQSCAYEDPVHWMSCNETSTTHVLANLTYQDNGAYVIAISPISPPKSDGRKISDGSHVAVMYPHSYYKDAEVDATRVYMAIRVYSSFDLYYDRPRYPSPMTTNGALLGDFLSIHPESGPVYGFTRQNDRIVVRTGDIDQDGRITHRSEQILAWANEPLRMVAAHYGGSIAAVGSKAIRIYRSASAPVPVATHALPDVGGIAPATINKFPSEQGFLVACPTEGTIRFVSAQQATVIAGKVGDLRLVDGSLTQSRWVGPVAVALGDDGKAYVLDAKLQENSGGIHFAVLREIDLQKGTVRTVAGDLTNVKNAISVSDPVRWPVRMLLRERRLLALQTGSPYPPINYRMIDLDRIDDTCRNGHVLGGEGDEFRMSAITDFAISGDYTYVSGLATAGGERVEYSVCAARTVVSPRGDALKNFAFREGTICLSYGGSDGYATELLVFAPNQLTGLYPEKPKRFLLPHRALDLFYGGGLIAYTDPDDVIGVARLDFYGTEGDENGLVETGTLRVPTFDPKTILATWNGDLYAYSPSTQVLRLIENPFSASHKISERAGVGPPSLVFSGPLIVTTWDNSNGDVLVPGVQGAFLVRRQL